MRSFPVIFGTDLVLDFGFGPLKRHSDRAARGAGERSQLGGQAGHLDVPRTVECQPAKGARGEAPVAVRPAESHG